MITGTKFTHPVQATPRRAAHVLLYEILGEPQTATTGEPFVWCKDLLHRRRRHRVFPITDLPTEVQAMIAAAPAVRAGQPCS